MAGGYSYVYVPEGHYEIEQKWPYWPFDMGAIREAVAIKLDVKAGDVRYVRFASGMEAAAATIA